MLNSRTLLGIPKNELFYLLKNSSFSTSSYVIAFELGLPSVSHSNITTKLLIFEKKLLCGISMDEIFCHWRRWCLVQIPDSEEHGSETVLRLLHSKMNHSWTDLQMNRELKAHYVSSLRLVYSILLLIPEIETATKISDERWKKIHKRFSWLRATIQWVNEKKIIYRWREIFGGSFTMCRAMEEYALAQRLTWHV